VADLDVVVTAEYLAVAVDLLGAGALDLAADFSDPPPPIDLIAVRREVLTAMLFCTGEDLRDVLIVVGEDLVDV
jgi:ABC-type nitrate/sulfonate/bicarbonate transport system substrate-binding protein